MNSTVEQPSSDASLSVEASPEANGSAAPNPKSHARTGKVARLPKNVRDSINRLIEDGLSYGDIIEKLGADGQGLNKHHISEWRTGGGFEEWQQDQQWLEEIRAQQQFGQELLQKEGETKINQIVLQVAITQVLQMLRHIAPTNLNGKFDTDPANFTRLLNSISRISRESLVFRKYDDAFAKASAAELKKLDPNRDLSDPEFDLLVDKMDKVFRVARPTRHRDSSPSATSGGQVSPPKSKSNS